MLTLRSFLATLALVFALMVTACGTTGQTAGAVAVGHTPKRNEEDVDQSYGSAHFSPRNNSIVLSCRTIRIPLFGIQTMRQCTDRYDAVERREWDLRYGSVEETNSPILRLDRVESPHRYRRTKQS